MKAKQDPDNAGVIIFFCPGCKVAHHIPIVRQKEGGPVWTFNGNFDTPTFNPSIVIRTGTYVDPNWIEPKAPGLWSVVCHSAVRDGQIKFAGDTTHEYRGQIVTLPEID